MDLYQKNAGPNAPPLTPEHTESAMQAANALQWKIPPAAAGQLSLPQMIQAIEKTSPGLSDEAKAGVLFGMQKFLEPQQKMLLEQQNEAYKRQWEVFKFGVQHTEHEREFDVRQSETQANREATQAYRQDSLDLRRQQIEQGAKQGYQILTDPKSGEQFMMVPGKPETAQTLAGEPYKPGGAQRLASGATGKWSDDAIEALVNRGLSGDPSVMQQLPRSGTARQQYEEALAKKLKESPGGIAGGTAQMQMNQLRMAEAKAAATTAGRVTMNTQLYAAEAEGAAKLVVEASKNVPRTELKPINELLLAAETNTGSPEVIRLGLAINSLLNAYGKMSNPTGTGVHEADKARLSQQLDRSLSQGQIEAGVDQVVLEGKNLAQAAYHAQMKVMANITPRPPGAPVPQAAQPTQKQGGQGAAAGVVTFQGKQFSEEPAGAVDAPAELKDSPDGTVVSNGPANYVKRGNKMILLVPAGQ
jgi:hypothetical protein